MKKTEGALERICLFLENAINKLFDGGNENE